jgi:hypothetical protein
MGERKQQLQIVADNGVRHFAIVAR